MKGHLRMYELDPHTHSLASGHASQSTITDLAKQASAVGLSAIGITDHGPATLCSSKAAYSVTWLTHQRSDVELSCYMESN